MKQSIKSLTILLFSIIIVFTSCSETEEQPLIKTTYKLTLEAPVPSDGETVYSTISYKKADGATVTLSDINTSFKESFEITTGFNMQFTATATSDAANRPSVSVKYSVDKYENDINVGNVCFGSSTSIGGRAGSWVIKSNNNFTFTGTSCQ